ncbi:hypothetical protein [Streptomyces sp. NPDC059009]|uniref:hypothetical protein n=1 Tax=Streptomyces sp. NPDC059009 TaxID=3346694 RepID=UPI0036AD0C6C
MSYDLQAVIAGEDLLRSAAAAVPGAQVAALPQGLALMPMTDEVLDSVTDGVGVDAEGALGFWRLPEGFEKVLADWSLAGPVAYVEAEYFGGAGEQQAAVWADGALELGPVDESTGDAGNAGRPAVSPISQALRRLGVRTGPGEDEFTAVGLDRHRDNDGWISPGTS